MDTMRRVVLSAETKILSQPRSGATLSDMKLGLERQLTTIQPTPRPVRAQYLFWRFAAAGLVALFVLCGVLSVKLWACATRQDDPPAGKSKGDAASDDKSSSQDEPKPGSDDAKPDSKKAGSNRDVKSVQELNLPRATLKEVLKGTRSQRVPAAEITLDNPLEAIKPTVAQRTRFNELRKPVGGAPEIKGEDLPLIDLVVKWQVYSMTQKDWSASEAKKNRDDIEQILVPGSSNEKFLVKYKELLRTYLEHLLDNNIRARVNAMILLGKVRDEQTIPLFVQQIRDPKQCDGVKYLAVKGIEYLGQHRLISKIALEADAVDSLLDMMAQGDKLEPFIRQACVRALGALGRPTRVTGQNDTKVAVALLKIIRDPNIGRVDRSMAVVALAGLHIPPELDYNFQYVAHEIAQFAAEAGEAALKDPALDDLRTHMVLGDAYVALTGMTRKDQATKQETLCLAERASRHGLSAGHRDPAYIRTLGDQINKLMLTALRVYKPEKPGAPKPEDVVGRVKWVKKELPTSGFREQLDELNELLKKLPPRSNKLSPDTEELGPPPALVGPKTSVEQEATEEAETEPEADSSQSAP